MLTPEQEEASEKIQAILKETFGKDDEAAWQSIMSLSIGLGVALGRNLAEQTLFLQTTYLIGQHG